MTEVLPGVEYLFYADLAATGLEGIAGVTVYLGDVLTTARTTAGIEQLGATTVYAVTITTPSESSDVAYSANVDDGTDVQWFWPFTVVPFVSPGEQTATPGPCNAWTTVEAVAEFCTAEGTDLSVYTPAVLAASEFLYMMSAKQFNGECEQTVRPQADGCGCWLGITSPMSVGAPQISYGDGWWWGSWAGTWGWGFAGCGANNVLGACGMISTAPLSGYPVTEILEVKIDGVVLDASEYRLDGYRYLTRMAAADGSPQWWPACQRVDRPDTEPGTWSATYVYGTAPPELGVLAANELACQLYRASVGGACTIPSQATVVTRQGITIQRTPFVAWAYRKGQGWVSGLPLVDAFLSAYNPMGVTRRSSVWSPDLTPFGPRLGTGTGS